MTKKQKGQNKKRHNTNRTEYKVSTILWLSIGKPGPTFPISKYTFCCLCILSFCILSLLNIVIFVICFTCVLCYSAFCLICFWYSFIFFSFGFLSFVKQSFYNQLFIIPSESSSSLPNHVCLSTRNGHKIIANISQENGHL